MQSLLGKLVLSRTKPPPHSCSHWVSLCLSSKDVVPLRSSLFPFQSTGREVQLLKWNSMLNSLTFKVWNSGATSLNADNIFGVLGCLCGFSKMPLFEPLRLGRWAFLVCELSYIYPSLRSEKEIAVGLFFLAMWELCAQLSVLFCCCSCQYLVSDFASKNYVWPSLLEGLHVPCDLGKLSIFCSSQIIF